MARQETEQKNASKSVTLDELIAQQDVSPANNLDEIADLWPVDDDPDALLQHVLQDRAERRQLSNKRG